MGNERQLPWQKVLHFVLLAVRSDVNNSSGFTPHRLLHGREMVLPADSTVRNTENIPITEYAQRVRNGLIDVEQIARENYNLSTLRQSLIYNRKLSRRRCFSDGDYVFRVNRAINRKMDCNCFYRSLAVWYLSPACNQ